MALAVGLWAVLAISPEPYGIAINWVRMDMPDSKHRRLCACVPTSQATAPQSALNS